MKLFRYIVAVVLAVTVWMPLSVAGRKRLLRTALPEDRGSMSRR